MISFSQLNDTQILTFSLVLLRITSFVIAAAIYGSNNISVPIKILFSIVLSLVVFKTVAINPVLVRVHENESYLIIMSFREVMIGLLIGLLTRLFFFTLSMAGEMVSVTMGLGQAQIFNPMMGSMGNALEQFYVITGTLIYLSLNGHHYLLEALIQSFQTSPLAVLDLNVAAFSEVVLKVQQYFIFGIKIAVPVLISMMIVQIGMALLSRAVPQINVIMTSAAITTLLGILIIFISLPLLIMQMTGLVDLNTVDLFKFIKTL